ncbi:hypothetical protein Y1Q_0003460 [Alligator mississippiensis]|uniref:Uncharacterized protein n=1 Tax=Alligator mississippiensis TaxID=8496 RepID=A0A151M485_ALLMI|nr:hypothetical protein Y1Q_0003460 [Alligator mississippiensis]
MAAAVVGLPHPGPGMDLNFPAYIVSGSQEVLAHPKSEDARQPYCILNHLPEPCDVASPAARAPDGDCGCMGVWDKWEQLTTQDKSVEIFQHITLMTLDSIMKCAFSYQSNCQTDSDNMYIQAILNLSHMVYKRIQNPLHHNDLIYWLSSQGRHFNKACKLAHLHTDKVIRERKEALKDERVLEEILKKRHLDFLDILLCAKDENGNGLSDEDLRAEVDTFMFEGHDTTASGISWLLYCMAMHPEHQRRCREEIQEILGDRDTVQWNCIGQQFAMNEMKVALVLTLLRFELSPDPEKPPIKIPQIILRSKNGIYLHLRKLY